MIEEQELREAKRARNFIWAAAEKYDFDPFFLAFAPDGTADMYLNLVIGLTYKWYDHEKIDDFFNQLGGKDQELYEGLLWIGLENTLYQKERRTRSAMEDLRREYALNNLNRYRDHREYARIEQIRNAHCREILGQLSGLKAEEQEILHAFSYTEEMTTEEILEQTRENLWKYFSYRPAKTVKKEGVYFLQKVAGAFHSVGKVSATYVRAKNYEDKGAGGDGKAGAMDRSKHYLVQFSLKNDPEEARKYVEACFGKSMYSQAEQERIERKICVDKHKNCHVLFTKGNSPEVSRKKKPENYEKLSVVNTLKKEESAEKNNIELEGYSNITGKREKREILEFQKEAACQYEKNKQYYEKNHAIYQNSIRKLTEKLRICLETQDETFPEMATHGKIKPREVWKAVYLDNPRVFERKEEVEIPGFSVDILIDASSSRKQMREQIAAQAYVLAKSLDACGIPAQIYSYCSIRGFTVMRIFKNYEEEQIGNEVFRYVAAGNNRDGLALRAAGHLMEASKKSRRILLVLTDASPMDDQNIGEGAFYANKEYTDQPAVEDTAREVQKLKQKGIQVIGIFMGSVKAGETAREIFGRKLVRIQNINDFAGAVGRVLGEVIKSSL